MTKNLSSNEIDSILNGLGSIDTKYLTSYLNSNSNDYKNSINEIVEFEQTNGNKILLRLNKDGIEYICEKKHKTVKMTCRFPFFELHKEKYVEFQYYGKTYKVKTTISALTEILKIDYTSHAELTLKDALKNG